MPWPRLNPYRELAEAPKDKLFELGEPIPTPVPSESETVAMLRQMLDAVLEENNNLREEILKLQNELDRERQKKLQSP